MKGLSDHATIDAVLCILAVFSLTPTLHLTLRNFESYNFPY